MGVAGEARTCAACVTNVLCTRVPGACSCARRREASAGVAVARPRHHKPGARHALKSGLRDFGTSGNRENFGLTMYKRLRTALETRGYTLVHSSFARDGCTANTHEL